jgi:aquaporin Z
MEGAELATFMLAACLATALLEHPASPVRQAITEPVLRRAVVGVAMGLTAVALVYSPLGRRSGAHFNPSVTLAFYRLGMIGRRDAAFYVVAQVIGALAGVLVAGALIGPALAVPEVQFAVTQPGAPGPVVAFAAELAISFMLMSAVLIASNHRRLHPFTGVIAGALVATYILVEAPLSGMSMNPARTLGSAIPAGIWTGAWIYLVAPPLGMVAAAEIYALLRGRHTVRSGKLVHRPNERCLFRCCAPSGEALEQVVTHT